MSTFLTVFNAFPAILQAVQTVEAAVPLPQAGQQKLNLVLGAAATAWEVGQVGEQITKSNWVSAVEAITNMTVAGLNAAGVFGTSQSIAPVPAPPVSSN
jgi:hypothetical protein